MPASAQLPSNFSVVGSQLGLDFPSAILILHQDFSSSSPQLFSSLALVVLNFPSRKLTTSLVFREGKL